MLRGLGDRLARYWRRRREGRRVRVVTPEGLVFHWIVDHRYPESMTTGTYEADLVAALGDVLTEGDAFLDVGANAGYLSLCAKLLVGGGTVVAFEPLPANLHMIERVLASNPEHPFEVVAAAVAGSEGTVELEVTRNLANPHLRGVTWEKTKPTLDVLSVPAVRLGPYLDRYRPRAVKIDTEGAEGQILASLGPPDGWAARPVFFVELHGSETAAECRSILEAWGYRLSTLDGRPIGGVEEGQYVVARPPGEPGGR